MRATVIFSFVFYMMCAFFLTQLSGVWGIYPYAFRCPDVDDLMNNTLGCMIGFWAAPILMHFLPSVEEMDMIAKKRGEKLEIIRAFSAFSVDWIVCNIINVAVNSIAKKGGLPHNTMTKTHLELDVG